MSRRIGLLRLTLLLVAFSPTDLRADMPFVVDQWRFGTRENGAALRYCIDARDPDWPVARRIASAVAGALLVQPKEVLIAADPATANLAGDDIDMLYRTLIERCDVYFGFKLVPDAYPAWIAVTRPYYRSFYAFVATDPGWVKLSQMPAARPIGATIGTAADLRLTQYLLAAGSKPHWDKFPMASDEAALRGVLRGTLGAALIWSPSRWAFAQTEPDAARLRNLAPDPLPVSTASVGAVLLSRQSFLRSSIDSAIASLSADGTIAGILRDARFPGEAVP
jgi:polar amino acid transport system substrate-binding protein